MSSNEINIVNLLMYILCIEGMISRPGIMKYTIDPDQLLLTKPQPDHLQQLWCSPQAATPKTLIECALCGRKRACPGNPQNSLMKATM